MGGGAAKAAYSLHKAYQEHGHDAWLAVGFKQSDAPAILQIPGARHAPFYAKPLWQIYGRLQPWEKRAPGVRLVRDLLWTCAGGESLWARIEGQENFNYPGSHRLLNLLPEIPDIVHLHNIHGGYFDLRYLITLSRQRPVIVTLHDAWLLSGHCAHSLDCERWQTGCGRCPDLSLYPGLLRDGSARNWQRKRAIYQKSQLYVVTPSHWLMNKVQASMLHPEQTRVIPNGIDLRIFQPGDQKKAREQLNLPLDAWILLYVGSIDVADSFKDFATLRQALVQLPSMGKPVILICLHQTGSSETFGQATIQFRAYETDETKVAAYYQAADIYVHAAKAENYPYVIMEAMACGLPVVASAVGGIPEQVIDGETGFLMPTRDASVCAEHVHRLLTTRTLRERIGVQAAQVARQNFSLDTQVSSYLQWYTEVLLTWNKTKHEIL